MHRFLTITGLFLLVLTPLSPSWALPYGDDTVEQALVSAEKKLKPKKLHGLLVGDWKVEVPDDLARELQILELALDPNSTANDFDKLEPTEDEITAYNALRKMLAETPNRPEVMVAMNKLEALNQNEIRFGEEQVTIRIAGAEQQQSYKIINAHTNALQIFWIETNELNDCVFINADTLRIFEGGQEKVRLSRK